MSGQSHTDALERLAALLREQGGLMATLVATNGRPAARGYDRPDVDSDAKDVQRTPRAGRADGDMQGPDTQGPAQTAASGPRAQGARAEYELLVETIYEGYLLHYGVPRVVLPPEDDLGLLAGDRLYALGLARLVALGDTEAVAELADTITLGALAQATGDPALAGAVWEAGAHAVGWGSSDAHRRAKRLAFAGAPDAIEAMRTSAGGA